METIEQKHKNFIAYVHETFSVMGIPMTKECQKFLDLPAVEMLSHLKLLLGAMPRDAIESVILNKINIPKKSIPPERLEKLQRYSQYFCDVARTL